MTATTSNVTVAYPHGGLCEECLHDRTRHVRTPAKRGYKWRCADCAEAKARPVCTREGVAQPVYTWTANANPGQGAWSQATFQAEIA